MEVHFSCQILEALQNKCGRFHVAGRCWNGHRSKRQLLKGGHSHVCTPWIFIHVSEVLRLFVGRAQGARKEPTCFRGILTPYFATHMAHMTMILSI